MKPVLEREIRDRIEAFLSEISELVQAQALAAVQEVFGDEAGRAARRASAARAPARNVRRPAPLRRAAVDAATVLDHVRAHEGERIEQIAEALGTTTRELKAPLSELLASKALRTEGQRRGTRYFLRAGKSRPQSRPARSARASPARARRKPARIRAAPKRAPARSAEPPAEALDVEPEPAKSPEPADANAQLEPSGFTRPDLM